MQWSMNTRPMCDCVRHSASVKRVCCRSIKGLPKAERSFAYLIVMARACSADATAPSPIRRPEGPPPLDARGRRSTAGEGPRIGVIYVVGDRRDRGRHRDRGAVKPDDPLPAWAVFAVIVGVAVAAVVAAVAVGSWVQPQ
jgi:hypothetical protein